MCADPFGRRFHCAASRCAHTPRHAQRKRHNFPPLLPQMGLAGADKWGKTHLGFIFLKITISVNSRSECESWSKPRKKTHTGVLTVAVFCDEGKKAAQTCFYSSGNSYVYDVVHQVISWNVTALGSNLGLIINVLNTASETSIVFICTVIIIIIICAASEPEDLIQFKNYKVPKWCFYVVQVSGYKKLQHTSSYDILFVPNCLDPSVDLRMR